MELSDHLEAHFQSLKQTEEGYEVSLFLQNLKNFYKTNEFVITFVCSKLKNFLNNYRHKTKRIICEELKANEIVSKRLNEIIDSAFLESNFEKVLECFSDVYSNKSFPAEPQLPLDIKGMNDSTLIANGQQPLDGDTFIKESNFPQKGNTRRVFVEREKKVNIVEIKEFKNLEGLKKNLAEELNLKDVNTKRMIIKFYNKKTKNWDNLKSWKAVKNDETLKIFHKKPDGGKTQNDEALSDDSLDMDAVSDVPNPNEESMSPKFLLENHIGEIISEYESTGGKKAWIKEFRLPPFDKKITKKMKRGEILTTKERILVCQTIQNTVVQFDATPSSKELDVFLECLFLTFPRLVEEEDYWITWKTWKITIGNVFATDRRRKQKEIEPPVKPGENSSKKGKRKKMPSSKNPSSQNKKLRSSTVATIHPDPQTKAKAGNVQESSSPEASLAAGDSESLEATFQERRKGIVTGSFGIQEVFITYPWLHKETEIFTEFSRVVKLDQDIDQLIEKGLQRIAPALLHLLKVQQKCREVADKEKELRACIAKKNNAVDFDFSMSLFALPLALGEDVDTIFKPAGSIYEAAIHIEFSGASSFEEATSFSVILEDVRVNCSSMRSAVAVFVSSFFIFHLAYPSDLKMFLTFIEENILNIYARRPPRVEKLTERIKEYFESKGEAWK